MQDFEFPYAKDKSTGKSSATLFFAYISYWLTFTLIIVFACQESLSWALVSSFVLFLITIYIYRARRLDGLKISRSGFEIDSDGKANNGSKLEDDEETPQTSKQSEGWGSASAKSD